MNLGQWKPHVSPLDPSTQLSAYCMLSLVFASKSGGVRASFDLLMQACIVNSGLRDRGERGCKYVTSDPVAI